MQILEERHGDVYVMAVDDHLDTSAAGPFEARLLELIESGERRILIDCGALEYVNSAGLKVLLLVAKQLEPLSGELVLCALSSSVMMVFETIGFTKIMKIAPTREAGLRAFETGSVP